MALPRQSQLPHEPARPVLPLVCITTALGMRAVRGFGEQTVRDPSATVTGVDEGASASPSLPPSPSPSPSPSGTGELLPGLLLALLMFAIGGLATLGVWQPADPGQRAPQSCAAWMADAVPGVGPARRDDVALAVRQVTQPADVASLGLSEDAVAMLEQWFALPER